MRFTVRSLGGKLVISAALMLLLCMLLFSITSWYVLKSFYEHEAISDARIHLPAIKNAYRIQIAKLIGDLNEEAKLSTIVSAESKPENLKANSREELQSFLEGSPISQEDRFSSFTIIYKGNLRQLRVLAGFPNSKAIPADAIPVINRVIGGTTNSALQIVPVIG